MAHFAVHGTWRSVAAMTALFAFIGLLLYAIVGGFPPPPHGTLSIYGALLYVLVFLTIGFGFWSKEDVIAVLGIMGLAALIILDILLRVGILSYNGIKVI